MMPWLSIDSSAYKTD